MSVHEITIDENGFLHGTDGNITVTLMDEGEMFKRRAIKGVGTEFAHEVCWLVAKLDGVRVYQQGNSVIVSRRELNP